LKCWNNTNAEILKRKQSI